MLKRFFIANVCPGDKLMERAGQTRPAGYFQTFGVTAETEEALRSFIVQYVDGDLDGTLLSIEDEGEPQWFGKHADLRSLVRDTDRLGIWYVSGRAFYMRAEDKPAGPKQ